MTSRTAGPEDLGEARATGETSSTGLSVFDVLHDDSLVPDLRNWERRDLTLLRLAADIGSVGSPLHGEICRDLTENWTRSTSAPALDAVTLDRIRHAIVTVGEGLWRDRTTDFDEGPEDLRPALAAFIGGSRSNDPDWASTPTSELRKQADERDE